MSFVAVVLLVAVIAVAVVTSTRFLSTDRQHSIIPPENTSEIAGLIISENRSIHKEIKEFINTMHTRSVSSTFRFLLLVIVIVLATTAAVDLEPTASSLRRNDSNNNNNKDRRRGLIVSRRKNRKPRIIGGDPIVDPDRYPYFALMDGSSFCGAVLVSPRFVLTAAHCVGADDDFEVGISGKDNTGGDDVMSFLESWWTGESSGSGSGGDAVVDYPYKTKRIHPDYSKSSLDGDLALYELQTDVDDALLPIRMESGSVTIAGTPLTAIGFGDTNPSNWIDIVSNDLLEVTVGYVPTLECENSYGDQITTGMLCAYEPGEDTCQGDSGGPLFLKGDDPEDDRLVGLVSWGLGCGKTHPGVYTRISRYYDWIVSTMCDLNPSAVPDYVTCSTGSGGGSGSGSGVGSGSGSVNVPTEPPTSGWYYDTGYDDLFGGSGGEDDLFGGSSGGDDWLNSGDDWLGLGDFSDSSESFINELWNEVTDWFSELGF